MTDNWIEACAADAVSKDDVLRFDHGDMTFCIYRTSDDRYYATGGLCTHAGFHLSSGFVMDHIIECPKHNGRFDFTTGQAKGAPACTNLRTYPVKVKAGKIYLNPA